MPACPPGRNDGLPTPRWWPAVRRLIEQNRSAFPPEIPLAFLGAWVEQESDGRHALVSKLDEVGYFQIHPAEAEDYFGTTIARVKADSASPAGSVRWGGKLLTAYTKMLDKVGVPKTGTLYLGLLKAMHWSPWARIWAQHVHYGLGRWPDSYDEFYEAMFALKDGRIPWNPGVKRPSGMPTCSVQQTIARSSMFPSDEDRLRDGSFFTQTLFRVAPDFMRGLFPGAPLTAFRYPLIRIPGLTGAGLGAGLSAASFPGISFGKPVDGIVTSVWGDSRTGLPVGHEGMDIPAPTGTLVRAVADGVVWHSGPSGDPDAGIWVGVDHAAGWASRYMHLSTITVYPGQPVKKGDVIGKVGQTGAKSGPHLHFSLLLDGALLPAYAAMFGAPVGGFGRNHGHGYAVPAEPLVPVDGYTDAARKRLGMKGVFPPSRVYDGRGATSVAWGLVGVGIGVVAIVAGMKVLKNR